jgi:hypothetical protein
MQKIRFKDLDWKLKVPVVMGWLWLLLFCVGFFLGFIGA